MNLDDNFHDSVNDLPVAKLTLAMGVKFGCDVRRNNTISGQQDDSKWIILTDTVYEFRRFMIFVG